ncbi:Cytochrome P450 monooxygenase [Pseudocercospora fuligena]|uniref:Cytochrome P450 monooxygenase n=1 Tax=Pseudocercospora fuligena TaxID=685502 RepID=A0A8H6RQI2_9PEZI|nr:Cytochrome P450 monooxygenase [Pseudocercospora fuligena]
MAVTIARALGGLFLAFICYKVWTIFYNAFLHPLAKFPGPIGVDTGWYKTVEEVSKGRNWTDCLKELHSQYGEIVRVGPNELHFSNPNAFHEIYNNANRWDKEETLYHCFGEDRSSFGFLTYKEAKQRKDVLAPLFSKRAIGDLQGLVKKNIDRLCVALEKDGKANKSSDMLFALRCFTLDVVTQYCFAKDVKSTEAKDFQAPIVIAMDASLPGFVVFRHFEPVRQIVFSLPGWLTKLTNPALAGLVDLQELLGAQVNEVVNNPLTLQKTPHATIYHRLMDQEANTATGVPSPGSLYEEAQALFFGGAESSGNTTMIGIYHILQSPAILKRLKDELRTIWPDRNDIPPLEQLEKLPYLTAIIKESLRLSPSVPAPLPRIVPSAGATISGGRIPGGTCVGQSLIFVHYSKTIFDSPETFDPERWLQSNSTSLEKWLVSFSRGPRSCLGQNLAMCELYIAFATLFRRFDIELDGTSEKDLAWRECFLPKFGEKRMRAVCRAVDS